MVLRDHMILIPIAILLLAAVPVGASWDNWNCNLKCYYGGLGGSPADTGDYFGVMPWATDDYDVFDSKKGACLDHCIYAWFHRPTWLTDTGWPVGPLMADWRSPIAEGTSKRWGTGASDTWNVEIIMFDTGHSGVFSDCGGACDPIEYPLAGSVYLTWEFGISEAPPAPLPPEDYTFTLIYRGGINPKPPGTKRPDAMDPPAIDTSWDMKATPYIVIPLWEDQFQPYASTCYEDCAPWRQAPSDVAKFYILVTNPDTMPSCAIAVDPDEPQEVPATFTFTATATGDEPFIFAWDFGDGSTATGNPVSHTYTVAGIYIVTCAVTDADGDSATCMAAVEVMPVCNPVCCFSVSPANPTLNDVVRFVDCSTDDCPITAWSWQFGDGGTSTMQNPTHQYSAVGSYMVALTIADYRGFSATCQQTVTVSTPPEPPLPDPNTNWNCNLQVYWGAHGGVIRDTSCYFGVMPGATDDWDVIDSKKPARPMHCNYVYAWFERRDWSQGMIMSDWRSPIPEGGSKRWGTSLLDTWNVENGLDNGPSGVFDECFGDKEYPIAGSVYISWEFGVTEEPPSPMPPDDYIFSLIYRGGINPKPTGTKLGDATVPMINEAWDMETTPQVVVPLWAQGCYLFRPYLWDCSGLGDPDLAKFYILVTNPQDIPYCTIAVDPGEPWPAPAVFTFTATALGQEPFTFTWEFGDGVTATGNPISHTYAAAGTYTVTCMVTDAGGDTATCTATAVVTLPNQPPMCSITFTPASPTTNDFITFHSNATDPDGSVASVTWDFGDGKTATAVNTSHRYDAAGTYTVTAAVVDNHGGQGTCSAEVTVTRVNRPPTCSISITPSLPKPGETATFDSAANDVDGTVVSVSWTFGDGAVGSGATTTHEYAQPGVYTVRATVCDNEGACETCARYVSVGDFDNPNNNWNCNLRAHWGAADGYPADTSSFFGVMPYTTDEYDFMWDSKKPCACGPCDPLNSQVHAGAPGYYVFAWFNRPAWSECPYFMADWRAPIAEGTSKRWGTHVITDTWNVKTNYDNGPSGYFHPCDEFQEMEYPVAAAIYITWEFGMSETPPGPLPPEDYTFSLMYRGGINEKPAGTLPPGVALPAVNQTWDMEAVPHVVVPLWSEYFRPLQPDCMDLYPSDMARFVIVVTNPDTLPTCAVAVDPAGPQEAPATFTFTASATGDVAFAFTWDFGDGNTAAGNPVSHTYTVADMYVVTCAATDADGDAATCMCVVDVIPVCNPICQFWFHPAAPTTADVVGFVDQSTDDCPITSWLWQFGDGGTSTAQNPSHQYSVPGTYTVLLTITDYRGFSVSCERSVTVGMPPLPDPNTNWNCNLRAYGGCVGCSPSDITCYLGVQPYATDGYDIIDAKKGATNWWGLWAWFERPGWGQGELMHDWRSPIAEGSSKRWGTAVGDTWNVKSWTYVASEHSGVFDTCGGNCDPIEYPVAGSVYITWEFGIAEYPPYPAPPADYTFSLIYRGGINPKPAGTKLPDAMDPPPLNTAWDMEATPHVVLPLWTIYFAPYNSPDCAADCSVAAPDTAKFYILVTNPDTLPTCAVAVDPAEPQEAPATFTFAASATGDVPFAFTWDFGDGNTAAENPVSHTYTVADTYTVTCAVTDADGDAATCSAMVEVTGPRLFCFTLAGHCWHRISLPCHATNSDPWEVFDELRPPNKPIDLLSGCLHRYDTQRQGYVTYWRTAPSAFGAITPGDGYLLWLFEDETICYQAQCGEMLGRTEFPTPGWYIMGTPHPGDTHIGDTHWRRGDSDAHPFAEIMNLWVQDPLVGWSCEWGRYYNVGLLPIDEDHYLRAFQGYWMYAFESDLTMEVPPP